MKVKIERMPYALDLPLPSYATEGAAGMDLRSAEDCLLRRGEIKVIPCGIKIALPPGYEGQIRARSGLASRGIIVLNSPGTVDPDYRGEIKVILANIGGEDLQIRRGERIAQLVVAPFVKVEWEEGEVETTSRGEGGLGHTGLK